MVGRRMTIYNDRISIWDIDMGDRYAGSDVNGILTGIPTLDMCYRYGIWYIDMVIYHIDMVILDTDMGYGSMIWEMTVSIRSSPIVINHIVMVDDHIDIGYFVTLCR